jgi:adenosylhomocysteine nucleosidase
MAMRVEVVVALHTEGRCLARGSAARLTEPPSVRVRVAGVGPENAKRAARAAVANGARALLSWGFAGALDPQLRAGALVLPSAVVAADGQRFPVDPEWHQRLLASLAPRLRVSTQPLGEVLRPLQGAAAKAAHHGAFPVAAVDMESAAIARVAREAGIAFAAVRAVADTAPRRVPASALSALDPNGVLRLQALLAALARCPRDLPALMALVPGFLLARRALRHASRAAGVAGALAPPPGRRGRGEIEVNDVVPD